MPIVDPKQHSIPVRREEPEPSWEIRISDSLSLDLFMDTGFVEHEKECFVNHPWTHHEWTRHGPQPVPRVGLIGSRRW